MTSAIGKISVRHPRLLAFEQLLSQISDGRDVWNNFFERLPLALGESSVDRIVPYSLSDQLNDVMNRAVDSLVDLIHRRRDPEYEKEKQRVVLPDPSMRVVLWPRRICPRTIPEADHARKVVRIALLESPFLDGGLLESWFAKNAGGRELLDALFVSLGNAFKWTLGQPSLSGIGVMVQLAVLNSMLKAKERIKKTKIPNLTYGRLEQAVGMALHALSRQVFESALSKSGRPPIGTNEHTDMMVALISLCPITFLSIRSSELMTDINPYSMPKEVEQLVQPIYQAALEVDNKPSILLKAIMSEVSRPGPLRTSLLQLSTCEAFRRISLDHLVLHEDQALEADQLLSYCFPSNSGILDLLDNTTILGQISADLTDRIDVLKRHQQEPGPTLVLLQMITRIMEQGPPWSRTSEADDLALQSLIERFLLYRLDEYSKQHLDQTRRRISDRRMGTDSATLRVEYEEGRLYRIGLDDEPMIQTRVVREEGQLFVDLKGYTRRTALAKELVMADFLKREFYEPILHAAQRYRTASQLVSKEQNIQLVNLLGDAVAFSGNVISLVNLARDIQDIFRAYREKLIELSSMGDEESLQLARQNISRRRLEIKSQQTVLRNRLDSIKQEVFVKSSLSPDEMVKELQKDYKARFEKVKENFRYFQEQASSTSEPARISELRAQIKTIQRAHERLKAHKDKTLKKLKGMKGEELRDYLIELLTRRFLDEIRSIEDRLRALDEEEETLDEARREDNQRRGAGLEAGLFISFGTAAEVISMEDDIWGTQRVAISERINEAARGTARNLVVKQMLDETLEQARADRAKPNLDLPFRVYIASTGTFRVEPALGRMWQKALADKDQKLVQRFISETTKSIKSKFSRIETGHESHVAINSNDIYNLGEAISGGALNAYLFKTKLTHQFFRVQIKPEELAPEIQNSFLFLESMLSLIVGFKTSDPDSDIELFRYVGQVLFRGFEGTQPTPVFEILRPDSPFFRLLSRHHLKKWIDDAQQNPERKIEQAV